MKNIFLAFLLCPSGLLAVTPDDLRQIDGEAERIKRLKASQIDPNNLSSLFEDTGSKAKENVLVKSGGVLKKTDKKRQKTNISDKNSDSTRIEKKQRVKKEESESNQNLYIPPPRQNAGKSRIKTDAVVISQKKYGIRMGTWISASLLRSTSNSDPGLIEVVLTEDVVGDVKTLEKGTILFADKFYNYGTSRLDMHAIKAITPSGYEMDVSGLVYDTQRTAGLLGIVTGNMLSESVKSGMSAGLINVSRAAVKNFAKDGSMAGAMTEAAADSIIDDKEAVLTLNQIQPYTIRVAAQDILIRIEETF